MSEIRKSLHEIAGGDYWHTTEEATTSAGRARITEMVDYLVEGDEAVVVAITKGFHPTTTVEDARADCLRGAVASLTDPATHGLDLAVLEERPGAKSKARDYKTFSDARDSGLVPKNFKLIQTSPRHEALLWLPDLAAHVIRREITHGERINSLKLARITEYPLVKAGLAEQSAAA